MLPSGENHESGRSLQSYSRVRVSRYEHGDEKEEGDQQQNHPGEEIRSSPLPCCILWLLREQQLAPLQREAT